MANPTIVIAPDAVEIEPLPPRPAPMLRHTTTSGPLRRAQLSCPVFPGSLPREKQDQVLFEDPQNGRKKLFLPRYRLSMFSDERGVRRPRIHLRRAAEFTITADLESYPAPELGNSARDAAAAGLTAKSTLQLQITRGESVAKQFSFQRMELTGTGLTATLTIAAAGEQEELRELMRDTAGIRFRLALTRRTDLAGLQNPGEVKTYQDVIARVEAQLRHLRMKLQQSPDIWIGEERTAIIYDENLPSNIRSSITYIEGRLGELESALARVSDQWLAETFTLLPQEPLKFLPEDLEVNLPLWNGLIAQTTARGHRYFQKADRPNRFYYLPDYFDLVADNGTPRHLKVRTSQERGRYQVEYKAFPRVDKKGRLTQDGSDELLRLAGPGFSSVELWPLQPDNLRDTSVAFCLTLPKEDDLDWAEQPRPNSCSDLHHQIADSFTVGPKALARIYDAMCGKSATLFTGKVVVKLGDWVQTVNFQGRVKGSPDELEDLWDRISEDAPGSFTQTISLRASTSAFRNGVTSIRVEFRRGESVTLTPEKKMGTSQVDREMRDFLKNRTGSAEYSYRVHVVSGEGTRTGEWMTSSEDVLQIGV